MEHIARGRYDDRAREAASPGGLAPDGTATPRDASAVLRRDTGQRESAAANRHWWDRCADDYQDEHGSFLGDDRFVWGPDGLDEAEAAILGDVAGKAVLEIGAGAAQCSRWLSRRGARPVALDVSLSQLRHSRRIDEAHGTRVAVVQADGAYLPFRAGSFDTVCSAFGAVPFVADSGRLQREVARVLRPGGRWAFAVPHPVRWVFPDDPGQAGLTARESYFDRTPYVEEDDDGLATYVEHHRTFGDRVRDIVTAGLRLVDVVEPEWPATLDRTWGGWSPLRGGVIPGTAIFVCERP